MLKQCPVNCSSSDALWFVLPNFYLNHLKIYQRVFVFQLNVEKELIVVMPFQSTTETWIQAHSAIEISVPGMKILWFEYLSENYQMLYDLF